RVQLVAHLPEQSSLDELRHQPLHLGRPEEEIDLGDYVCELSLVALDHATDGDDSLATSLCLEARRFDHGVDRFLLGSVDEAAGIDDDDFSFSEIRGVFGGITGELREVSFAVDGVLVATERDDADFHSIARTRSRAGAASTVV